MKDQVTAIHEVRVLFHNKSFATRTARVVLLGNKRDAQTEEQLQYRGTEYTMDIQQQLHELITPYCVLDTGISDQVNK